MGLKFFAGCLRKVYEPCCIKEEHKPKREFISMSGSIALAAVFAIPADILIEVEYNSEVSGSDDLWLKKSIISSVVSTSVATISEIIWNGCRDIKINDLPEGDSICKYVARHAVIESIAFVLGGAAAVGIDYGLRSVVDDKLEEVGSAALSSFVAVTARSLARFGMLALTKSVFNCCAKDEDKSTESMVNSVSSVRN